MWTLVRSRRVWAAALLAVLGFGVASLVRHPAPAAAHPLGNFTINRYSRI